MGSTQHIFCILLWSQCESMTQTQGAMPIIRGAHRKRTGSQSGDSLRKKACEKVNYYIKICIFYIKNSWTVDSYIDSTPSNNVIIINYYQKDCKTFVFRLNIATNGIYCPMITQLYKYQCLTQISPLMFSHNLWATKMLQCTVWVSDWGGESEEILYLDFLPNGSGEWVLNVACHSWDSKCSTTNVYTWLQLSGTSLMFHPKIQLYISWSEASTDPSANKGKHTVCIMCVC